MASGTSFSVSTSGTTTSTVSTSFAPTSSSTQHQPRLALDATSPPRGAGCLELGTQAADTPGLSVQQFEDLLRDLDQKFKGLERDKSIPSGRGKLVDEWERRHNEMSHALARLALMQSAPTGHVSPLERTVQVRAAALAMAISFDREQQVDAHYAEQGQKTPEFGIPRLKEMFPSLREETANSIHRECLGLLDAMWGSVRVTLPPDA